MSLVKKLDELQHRELTAEQIQEMHSKLMETCDKLKEIIGEEDWEEPTDADPVDLITTIIQIVAEKDARIKYLENLKNNPNAAIDEKMNGYMTIIQSQILSQNENNQAEKLKRYKAKLETKRILLKNLKAENKELKEQIAESRQKFVMVENKLEADLEKKNNLIQKLATGMQGYMTQNKEATKEFEDEVEELNENLQEAQDEIDKMKIEATERNERLKEAKEEIKKENVRNRELREELKGQKEELMKVLEDMRIMKKEHKEEVKDAVEKKAQQFRDFIDIRYRSNMMAPPTPAPAPASRQQKCQTNYLIITKEFPDALKLVDISELVDMIWNEVDMDEIREVFGGKEGGAKRGGA